MPVITRVCDRAHRKDIYCQNQRIEELSFDRSAAVSGQGQQPCEEERRLQVFRRAGLPRPENLRRWPLFHSVSCRALPLRLSTIW